MADVFQFEHHVEFLPNQADEILRAVPAAPGVFALRGEREADEPYLTRTADLRRRLRRLLAPPEALDEQGRPVLSKRLNLRDKVRFIRYTRTGSEFESALVLYCATRSAFGETEARRRLRLHAPYFLRVTLQHEHPRVYTTNKLSSRALNETFGPFPSRIAAERYGDAVLDLFKLRRCHEDLQVHPEHPGCAYGEMKKCIEPCKGACSAEDYASEAARVLAFFSTRGESMLSEVAAAREAASEAMDFEQAAALHKQWERVKAAAALADELVRPVAELRAIILQEAAPRADPEHADRTLKLEEAAVFLLDHGRVSGPERLSTLGVRAVREQTAVGSSLFAQPLMLAPIPLEEAVASSPKSEPPPNGNLAVSDQIVHPPSASGPDLSTGVVPQAATASLSPEDRARKVLTELLDRAAEAGEPDVAERCDFVALFRRWYYRPEKQRTGEVFLPNPDGTWPVRRILNGAARIVLGPPAAAPAADREAFKDLRTKVIHAGREGVERTVPVLPKRSRSRKAVLPSDILDGEKNGS